MVGYARRARVYSILNPSTAYSVESETGVVEERLASLKRVTDSDIEFAKRPRHWHSSKWPNTDNRRYTETRGKCGHDTHDASDINIEGTGV